jgi:hypothetical protein
LLFKWLTSIARVFGELTLHKFRKGLFVAGVAAGEGQDGFRSILGTIFETEGHAFQFPVIELPEFKAKQAIYTNTILPTK